MTELTEEEFNKLPIKERSEDKWEGIIQSKVKHEWLDLRATGYLHGKHQHRKVYRLLMENTAPDLCELKCNNDNAFFKLLDLSPELEHLVNLKLKFDRYVSYKKGIEEGKKLVQSGLKELLAIN